MTDTDTHEATPEQLGLLPDYHGRAPVGMKTSLTGTGKRVTRAHELGDRVVLIVEAKVKKASHEDTDDGLVYAEQRTITDMWEVEGQAAGRLLTVMRQNARANSDAATGNAPLEGADGTDEADMGTVGYTDPSGVVLTPAEVADMRGDPVAAIIGDVVTVVIVYDDKKRALWPDEFAPDTPRPDPGEVVLDDNQPRTVHAVLNAETGEVIAQVDEYDPDGDAFDDGVPDINDGVPDVDDVPDGPDPDDPEPGDDEIARMEAELPTTSDFEFVDKSISDLKLDLDTVNDAARLRRLVNAEKQGRGRGLKARTGALDAINARLESVTSGVKLRRVK